MTYEVSICTLGRSDLERISRFFLPKSIAIIGVSRKPGKIGHEILRNIKLSGYEGRVYPVNTSGESILGYKTYKSVEELEAGTVDLAIIAVPAESTESVMRGLGSKRVPAVVVISSGFSEVGNFELESKIVSIARASGMRLIGPNTFGIFCSKSRMNATFGPNYVLPGKTAFITQSGALGLALMDWTTEERYGVSAIVSIGNKADVDDADLLDFLAQDVNTASVLIYMEGLKNGRKFINSARKTVRAKPLIIIKAGTSKKGAVAASSHTGSIAGQDRVFSAAIKEAGVMRAGSMTQAFDWIQAINENPVPRGENIVIVTNGGGIGVLATDRCEDYGINLMEIPEDLKDELRKNVPSFGSLKNPIDMTANADDAIYGRVLSILVNRKDVHGIVALFCQTANIDAQLVAQAIVSLRRGEVGLGAEEDSKPITIAFIGGRQAQAAYSRMIQRKFAAYPTAERAVDGMFALIQRYRAMKDRHTSSARGKNLC